MEGFEMIANKQFQELSLNFSQLRIYLKEFFLIFCLIINRNGLKDASVLKISKGLEGFKGNIVKLSLDFSM